MTDRLARALLGAAVATSLFFVPLPASAQPTDGAADGVVDQRVDAPLPQLDPATLQATIGDLIRPESTSAQLKVSGTAGRWYGSAGVADRRSRRAVGPGDRFRAGSITKMFVATVVLQLVAEHRLRLDTPVQDLLPGLIPDQYAPITVANLLNHTSGLPPMSGPGVPALDTPEAVLATRFDRWTPRRLVATQTRGPMTFEPGTRQEYRGVNYVLLAILIEQVTGQPYGVAVGDRILRPLGLHSTVIPGHDPRLHGRHVHGYLRAGGRLVDVTVFDQSFSYGEGELVTTSADLDHFLAALFAGRLLPREVQSELFRLPPASVRMWAPGGADGGPARYSNGLQTVTVNDVTFWGKTGETYGYQSAAFSTRDGRRRLVLSTTPTGDDESEPPMAARVADVLTRPSAGELGVGQPPRSPRS
ncbi:serine hydrolase domain-containing protein [Mumia sp. Pv 4-285]|uniref:serine hydrolase domain-containing protein n=1 Tax=Mumia qirimensis TaxID=3234852 RepID=UPI00351D40AA